MGRSAARWVRPKERDEKGAGLGLALFPDAVTS